MFGKAAGVMTVDTAKDELIKLIIKEGDEEILKKLLICAQTLAADNIPEVFEPHPQ